jgi:hypothetical protein
MVAFLGWWYGRKEFLVGYVEGAADSPIRCSMNGPDARCILLETANGNTTNVSGHHSGNLCCH